jgi:hypothetical protein
MYKREGLPVNIEIKLEALTPLFLAGAASVNNPFRKWERRQRKCTFCRLHSDPHLTLGRRRRSGLASNSATQSKGFPQRAAEAAGRVSAICGSLCQQHRYQYALIKMLKALADRFTLLKKQTVLSLRPEGIYRIYPSNSARRQIACHRRRCEQCNRNGEICQRIDRLNPKEQSGH